MYPIFTVIKVLGDNSESIIYPFLSWSDFFVDKYVHICIRYLKDLLWIIRFSLKLPVFVVCDKILCGLLIRYKLCMKLSFVG